MVISFCLECGAYYPADAMSKKDDFYYDVNCPECGLCNWLITGRIVIEQARRGTCVCGKIHNKPEKYVECMMEKEGESS